jgi:hypothetical protein
VTELKFNLRPSPVLPEHRPLYKITQVLLVLDASRGGKSSLLRLHLFNWAFKSQPRLNLLTQAVEENALSFPTWGFDPALAIALRFAVAEKLIGVVSSGYKIEETGRLFLKEVLQDYEMFAKEKLVLAEIGKAITEKMVQSVAKAWE